MEGTPVLVYSSDGKRLLSDEDGAKYRLWDTNTGRLIAIVGDKHQNDPNVVAAAFSQAGSRVAVVMGKDVQVSDSATGQKLATIGPQEWLVGGVYFSPDGKQICTPRAEYTTGPDTAALWNAETGKPIAKLVHHRARVNKTVYNTDGTILATASMHPENQICLWDTTNGKLIHAMPGHLNSVNVLCFSPDGTRLVSASMDQTSRLWDVKTGTLIAVMRGHWAAIEHAAFSPTASA